MTPRDNGEVTIGPTEFVLVEEVEPDDESLPLQYAVQNVYAAALHAP